MSVRVENCVTTCSVKQLLPLCSLGCVSITGGLFTFSTHNERRGFFEECCQTADDMP